MGAIVLLFSVILWKMECNEQTKVDWILFFITGILISLLRSNGFYAYVLCIPFIIFFMKKKRVQTGLICIATVFLVMFVKGPVMEHYKVVQPDTIEALSIPAQHIARVITDGGELTQEQEELLSKVVDLERVPKEYDSTISDPIKTLVREKGNQDFQNTPNFHCYHEDSYLLKSACPRFGTGEAKGILYESVRGADLFILADVTNYSLTYNVCGHENHMSPDDHYQDLKRVIAAIGGKARRVNVIMPYLYEGRQSKRIGRESLDCATSLHELINMGVENIITFDAHDPQIQNATPLHGFETVQPSYQFIKALLNHEQGLHIDNEHFMIISE